MENLATDDGSFLEATIFLRQGPKTTESGGVTGRFTLVRGIPARALPKPFQGFA